MTKRRCEEYQSHFVADLQGELKPLQRERLQTHLSHCSPCATLYADLERGFGTARAWRPEISADHLARLTARLQPYVQSSRPRIPWRLNLAVASAALATLLVAIGLVVSLSRSSPLSEEATPVAPAIAFDFPADLEDWHPEAALSRQAPSRFLRLVASEQWDGQIAGIAREMSITMTRGFAVFAFAGGHKRTLRISAPGVLVEVVGTRFFVEAHGPRVGSTVGVAEGRVRVLTDHGSTKLSAGEQVTFDAKGHRVAEREADAHAYLEDTYLLGLKAALAETSQSAHRARRSRRHKTQRLAKQLDGHSTRAADPKSKEPGIEERFQWAEELVQMGAFREAMAAYRAIADDPRPQYDRYRDLCRYEVARIAGFNLGEIQSARVMLRDLAKRGSGEVRRQATLAMCELLLAARPCHAKACLKRLLEEHTADFDVTREAAQLLDTWHLTERFCIEDAIP